MRSRPVVPFLVLAYGLSWSIFAVAKWGLDVDGPIAWTVASALFMFGPAMSALILRRPLGLAWRDLGVVFHSIRWKWMGIAVLIALALPPFAIFFNWVLGDLLHFQGFGHTALTKEMLVAVLRGRLADAGVSAETIDGRAASIQTLPVNGPLLLVLMLLFGAIAGCTVNFIAAMGEELGWRGMLSHSIQRLGLLRQVLFTGLVWGLWHAPLILEGHNYPDHPRLGVAFMCLFTTVLALPLTWVRYRSGCVWAAGLLHGTVNAVASITGLFTQGASGMLGGGAGLSSVLGMGMVGALLFLLDPGFRKALQSFTASTSASA
jgi:membrane protease YdiL (CAAX protease family)